MVFTFVCVVYKKITERVHIKVEACKPQNRKSTVRL